MKENKGEHPLGDALQLILLVVFLVVWVLDSFVFRKSVFLSGRIPLYLRIAVLAALEIVAFMLFRSGRVAVEPDKRSSVVLSSGAFSYVRHPLYLASLLFYLGLTVSTASLYSLALFMIIFIFYDYIAGYEEKLMEIKHGDAYLEYRDRTGKWIPKISGRRA
jgi:protein-S-isoprenylcysteine O-methyltransferase Ste14